MYFAIVTPENGQFVVTTAEAVNLNDIMTKRAEADRAVSRSSLLRPTTIHVAAIS